MSIDDFMEGMHLIQDNYHQKLTKEQLKQFYKNLKDMDKESFIANIEKHIKTSQYMPNIAQMRDSAKITNFNNINLNSCYWYLNEREYCDEHNISYYDITDCTKKLSPFKNIGGGML